jgi:hypothetical protein
MALSEGKPQFGYPQEWATWLQVSPPRVVRMRQGHRFLVIFLTGAVIAVPLILMALLAIEWRAHPPKQIMHRDLWSAVPFFVGPLIVLLVTLSGFKRDRRLMRNGALAIGIVTKVRKGKRGRGRIVTYDFLDGSGRLISASSADNTRSYAAGMPILVFFNIECPETDQVALCQSVYEVAPLESK